ncbi:MAG: hypothetical protein R3D05_21020 [Dongiaceae bacterium]
MHYAQLKWPAPFLITGAVISVAMATLEHVRLVDLLLDSGTGLLASVGAVFAGTQLFLGQLSPRGRFGWQLTLAAFLFVALSEFCEPFTEAVSQRLEIDNFDDILILALAPVAVWFLARLKPVPFLPQRWILVGFALQAVSTILDFLDDGPVGGISLDPTRVATYADLAQLLSLWSYVLAVSWAASRKPS